MFPPFELNQLSLISKLVIEDGLDPPDPLAFASIRYVPRGPALGRGYVAGLKERYPKRAEDGRNYFGLLWSSSDTAPSADEDSTLNLRARSWFI
jgi:hypothetical protein